MAALPSPDRAPVFICGNDRSGTTMLRVILDRGEVAIPTPSMFLIDFAPVRRGQRGQLANHRAASEFAREVWSHPKVRLWGLQGEAPSPPEGLTHDEAYRFAVEAPYLAYARQAGTGRWGDKTAPYVGHIDEILSIWPHARIVVLVRDGRDVALSVMRMPFGANNVWAAARDWKRGIELGEAAERRHPRNVASFRYEDLVAEPERVVRAVCDHAQLAYDPAMLEIEHTPAERIERYQRAWHTNIFNGINTGSVGRWREQLSPRDQATFHAVAGDTLRRLGYEIPEHAPVGAPATPARLALAVHDKAARIVNFGRHRLVAERGRELPFVIRRRLRRV